MALANWPQPEQTSCLLPRLRRAHSFSRFAGSLISARYTLYPSHPNTRVQSFSIMETSVPGLTEPQNPHNQTLFPDSPPEPICLVRLSGRSRGQALPASSREPSRSSSRRPANLNFHPSRPPSRGGRNVDAQQSGSLTWSSPLSNGALPFRVGSPSIGPLRQQVRGGVPS